MIKADCYRTGSELLDDLIRGLKKAEDNYKRVLKEEPDNAKKIQRSEEAINYYKKLIAEKEVQLGKKSKNK